MSDSDNQMQYESNGKTSATLVAGEAEPVAAARKSSAAKAHEKMRSSPRKIYPFHQRVAPMHGGLRPSTDEYFNVECNDISQGGISFYLKRPPGCDRFAIVLGQKPKLTVLVGRVVYSKEVDRDGQPMYLVGCQFIDRLQK
jgi:hypothetical protein